MVFAVRDEGIGVPAGERRQLFKKFFRGRDARKSRPDGTGIGLFVAKRVVEEHGGRVIFEPGPGRGSRFGFALPLEGPRS